MIPPSPRSSRRGRNIMPNMIVSIGEAFYNYRHNTTSNMFRELSLQYGGKGAGLGLASYIADGCYIPHGWLISHRLFDEFVEREGLKNVINNTLSNTDFGNPIQVAEASHFIQDHIINKTPEINSPMPPFNKIFYAVRSSAIGEDGIGSSFAGQHRSILGCRPETIPHAIKECWASLFNEEAMIYRYRLGLPIMDASMGVVIQE